jgi:glycogen(starch) synthase
MRAQLRKLARDFAPDLVHINCFGPGVLLCIDTVTAVKAPLLVTLHGDRYPRPAGSRTLLEQTLRMARWVTGPSAATVEYARGLVPEIDLPSSVIYNGVQPPPIVPTPVPAYPPQLLCLGRLASEKGFNLALEAFASIVERFPAARLILAGDGPERPALEQQAKRLRLTKSVQFIGWVTNRNAQALINTSTLLLMPSYREGLPFVAIEAALMGRPVVATRVGGLAEVVLHQETGILVEKESVSQLSEAISFLLDHARVAHDLGQAAKLRAKKMFTLQRCVDTYDELYANLRLRRLVD